MYVTQSNTLVACEFSVCVCVCVCCVCGGRPPRFLRTSVDVQRKAELEGEIQVQ